MRNKDDTKLTVKWILFNIFVLWLFFCGFYNGLPKKNENHIQVNEEIDEIILITANKGPDYLNIYIDSERYVLSGEDLVKYVYENFNSGASVSIRYITEIRLFYPEKIITEFSADDHTYCTIEEYNISLKGVSTSYLVLFAVFEFFNISATIFFLWCTKPLKKKKRKKTKKVNTSF